MKAILILFFLSCTVALSAQENCLNGIDDDGDGLIDLNDVDDCDCLNPISTVIFEDFNTLSCCPDLFTTGPGTGIYCLEGGWTLVGGTADYFHTCDYLGGGMIPFAPLPFPSGDGVVGGINTPSYGEYIGYCIPGSMIDSDVYNYSMYVGFNDGGSNWNSVIPTEIGIYGTNDCAIMDDFNTNCLEDIVGWQLIESVSVGGNMGEWTFISGSFVNTGDYEAIAFGPTCQDESIYTFYDDFSIEGVFNIEAVQIEDNIVESGDCINGVTLSINNMPGFDYQWYLNGVAILGATGLNYNVPPGQEGAYEVLIYDGSDCGIYDPYELFIDENVLNIDADISGVQCYAELNGSITLNLPGGNTPYDIIWENGDMTPTISGLAPGNYDVTITDANGCYDITSFTVGGPSAPVDIEIIEIQQPKENIVVASATVNPSGGTPGYTIDWDNGESGTTASNLAVGFHTVMVTDANGCTNMVDFQVYPPLMVTVIHQDITCSDCDGTIDVSVSGGLPGYSILWNSGNSGFNLSSLCSQDYSFIVTDGFGTECAGSQFILSPPPIEVTEISYDELICFGDPTGDIIITVDGGTPGYSFLWSNSSEEQNLIDAPPGDYNLIVTDQSGCTEQFFYNIFELNEIDIQYNTVEPGCNSNVDGLIELTISGGLPGYSVEWSNGMSGQTISGLTAGNYQAVVTDDNGCTAEIDIFLSGGSDFTFSPQIVNASCADAADGSITVDATGTGTVTYLWEDNTTDNMIDSLIPGTYIVIITDDQGCTTSLSYEVDADIAIEILATQTDTVCFGEQTASIQLDIITGDNLEFQWDNGMQDQNLTNIGAGDYSVIISDQNMCTEELIFTIEESDEILLSPNIADEECLGDANGSITVMAQGGSGTLNYLWEDATSSNILSDLSEGIYKVTITDQRGCQKIDSFEVQSLSNISLEGILVNAGCAGEATGSIDLSIDGGSGSYQIEWDTGEQTEDLMNLAPGDYTVMVTDNLGCTSNASYTIESGANLSLDVQTQDLRCFEDSSGEITILLTGGNEPISYFLDGNPVGTNNINLPADTYIIEVMDADGCNTQTQVTLNQPPLLEAVVINTVDVDISGFGSATIAVQGGVQPYDILWDNGEMDLNATMLTAGVHVVTIRDANGCETTLMVNIESSILAVDFIYTDNVCFGECNGTAEITVLSSTGQVSFNWDNGEITPTLSNLCNGNYSCMISDEAGNTAEVNVSITSYDSITIESTLNDVRCFGESTGSIDLNISGGAGVYQIFINGTLADITNENLPAGNYQIEVIDNFNCTAISNLDIAEPPPLDISGIINPLTCNDINDANIVIDVQGGTEPYSINWNGITSPEELGPGEYDLVVTDLNGCIVNETFTIDALEEIEVDFDFINPFCDEDGTIQILWDETFPLLLNGESVNLSPNGTIENLNSGNYQIAFLQTDDCEVQIGEVNLEEEIFIIEGIVEESIETEFGGTVTLDISDLQVNGGYNIQWFVTNAYVCTETDQNGNCLQIELTAVQDERLEIVVENSEGCMETFFFDINLLRADNIYIPNITAGRLSENFKIFAESDLSMLNLFEIYDRWGQKIYTEKSVPVNSMEGWDLQYKNKQVLAGVYVYHVLVEFADGTVERFVGDVTVVF